jgi:predicted ABC-type ATPase
VNTSVDTLDPETHARIFAKEIVPESGLLEASSQVRPKAIILGGQPGAGKGGLVRAARAELSGDVVIIDPDEMRKYHPRLEEFRATNPYDWSTRTHQDAGQWADELRDAAINGKKNFIFDTTLSNGEWWSGLINKDLKDYDVEIHVVATSKLESELGVDRRFSDSLDREGHGRYVPEGAREAIYNKVPSSLDMIRAQTNVPIRIFDREGKELYDSRTDPRSPGEVLEQARAARLQDPEVTRGLNQGWQEQKNWHENLAETIPNNSKIAPETAERLLTERSRLNVVEGVTRNASEAASLDYATRIHPNMVKGLGPEVPKPVTELPIRGVEPAGVVPEAPNVVTSAVGEVLGVGGVALMGYDAYKTTEQYQALSARGINFGADALLHQYEGRTAGGVVGSIGAGMAYGFVAGSESGPGALLTGAAGGVVGAFAGDKIATAYNEYKVNHQTGTDGVTYAYANGNWTAAHANVDWSHPTPDGFPGVALSKTQAPAAQLPTLDYKRTTAVTELALANPATQDTKTIKLDNTEWHASRDGWTKDVQVTLAGLPQADDFGRPITVGEKADAKTGAQLDQIAVNRQYNNAHYTEAVSQAYVMDYYGKGWNKVGPLPDAITQELKLPSETHIKDPATGFTWTADGKGQFSRNETTVGYDTPVTQTVKASGEELARVSKLQQEAVQSNAAYGSQLIAQKYQQLEAPTQQQAPVQPTPASHPGQAASTIDPTKTAQAPVAGHSPEFQALSAKLQRISAAMESGDTASLRKEAEPYVNSPQGQSISAQAKANVQREEPSREQQRDPRDASHPDYALNKDIRTQLESLYTRSGVYPTDKMLDHVTAAVALNAREQGITHVDELRFNADKSAVIAMQNPSNQDMFSRSSATNIQQAMQTPPEHAYQQMAQVTQQQAQTQQNIQQQIAQSQQSQQPQQGPSLG